MNSFGTAGDPSSPSGSLCGTGSEGQRKADRGNGCYLNPIVSGDRPDPSILKLGDDYYLVHSTFESVPGLLIWHSKDLVNWEPVCPALWRHVGSVYAPDLVFHDGRFYIYFPAVGRDGITNMVVYADEIDGPWSDPVDLRIGRIDPGHAVSPDGRRFLFMSDGFLVPLADDGLSVTGPAEKVYSGWKYPEHWVVETFALEGPKITCRGDRYYMLVAQGGTAGPPTSHMVVMARSKAIQGPWKNSPHNPVVRTSSASEKWWSRGHGTLVEGPDRKQWYLVYHGYENGYLSLGRQTLLEPVKWTPDGWLKSAGYDVGASIPMPAGGSAVQHAWPLSDDFRTNRIGTQWTFYQPTSGIEQRYRFEEGALVLKAFGSSPKDCSPLTMICGDHGYEVEVDVEVDEKSTGGLLLFYSPRLFTGLGFSEDALVEYWRGDVTEHRKPESIERRVAIRIRNDRHIVTIWYSADRERWTKHSNQYDVSGYHHNTAGGFLSLRPALFASGSGQVRFRKFRYCAVC